MYQPNFPSWPSVSAVRSVIWLLGYVIFPGGCSRDSGAGDSAEITAFVGVTVVPMTELDITLPDHTVVVEGEQIVAVGPTDEVPVPAGALRIDAAGRYLIPGLADMHVHLEYFEEPDILKLFLAHGVTTVRSMDGRDYILDWRSAVAEGALLGPTIYTAGPLLDGDPPILPDNTVVRSADAAEAIVRQQAAAGYDFVKVYTNLSPDAYRSVLNTAHEFGLPVVGHIPRNIDLAEVRSGGQTAIEHLADLGQYIEAGSSPFLNGWHWSKLYVGMPVDTAKLSPLASDLADAQIWIVPTMVQANRALAPPATVSEWMDAAEVTHMPGDWLTAWEQLIERSTARMDADDWALVDQGRQNRENVVQALHQAGVRLLVGTDTPNPFVVPGNSVAEELENFVEVGMTPAEAMMAATRNPALFFGALEDWGTIEPGKRADLVLLEADPLDEIGNVRRQVGVMVRGRWLPEIELKEMLSDLRLR